MSPSRSKAIVLPSGLTSTFIQVPSVTWIGISRVGVGGAATSHFGFSCAKALVERRSKVTAARAVRMRGETPDLEGASGAISRPAAQAGPVILPNLHERLAESGELARREAVRFITVKNPAELHD